MSSKIHVRHILVEHRYEAEDLLRRLQSGEAFEKLAEKFSKCSSSSRGGDLGELDPRRLDSDFADAALKLKSDELSPIVRTRFGYHLIQRIS